MPAELFRRRMTTLWEGGYRVLSLTEGLDRLANGNLPSRAVTITFDDGFVDFSRVAYPILKDLEFPATVYVSTQYVQHQFPAFPPILEYILWRANGREADGRLLIGDTRPLRTATASDRLASFKRLTSALGDVQRMAPAERDDFAASVAHTFEVDYDSIKCQRLFHLMTEQELTGLDHRLVDVQLHTHHHIQPHERRLFHREIEDNRRSLEAAGIPQSGLRHFCYPSGEVRPELPGWLREQGVQSATTCVPGIASNACDLLRLPRFIDTQEVSALKFDAWLCGAAALLPQRG